MITPVTCSPTRSKEVFGLDRSTIYRWADKGYIKIHKRVGRSFLVVQDVLDFIKTGETSVGQDVGQTALNRQ